MFLFAFGCASNSPAGMTRKEQDRVAELEKSIADLKAITAKQNEDFMKELALIRDNLDAIHALLQEDKARTNVVEPSESEGSDHDLDTKAKSFVSESLDRLFSITGELLNSMEKKLDDQLKKDTPAPKSDEI